MEDEEDDVFEPDPNCWRTPFREIKCEDRGTQTHGPGQALHNSMLPCHFELVGDFDARQQEEQNRMEQLPLHQPAALSLEASIGQKLQLIGDQFHR
uniref:Bcl2 modifying factor 2 n=1 Tax=Xiphophorus couchianus TaxID=32473 RepID=A0A3B5LV95_9TELE